MDKYILWIHRLKLAQLIEEFDKVMKKHPNNASQAFRAAANGLQRTDNWLGYYFRKMRSKGGQKHAIVCTARKLAIIIWNMIIKSESYHPASYEVLDKKRKSSQLIALGKRLAKMNLASDDLNQLFQKLSLSST